MCSTLYLERFHKASSAYERIVSVINILAIVEKEFGKGI